MTTLIRDLTVKDPKLEPLDGPGWRAATDEEAKGWDTAEPIAIVTMVDSACALFAARFTGTVFLARLAAAGDVFVRSLKKDVSVWMPTTEVAKSAKPNGIGGALGAAPGVFALYETEAQQWAVKL